MDALAAGHHRLDRVLGAALQVLDDQGDLAGRDGGAFGQLADLVGDDGKALAVLAGLGSYNFV